MNEGMFMRIIYCRVGWMNAYQGSSTERPQGGGKYNIENIGHEVYNYQGYNGQYYGFVEAGVKNSIHVEKLCGDKKAEYADDVLAVWIAKKPSGGQVIVGWYENARVYRTLQIVPNEAMVERKLKTHDSYNIFSNKVYLIDSTERKMQIDGMGHSNIWYGDKGEGDAKVAEYIKNYGQEYEKRITKIEDNLDVVVGEEKDAIVKVRINQDRFRSRILNKYAGKCCLCGVDDESLLIASHIKPWAKSDEHEKLDLNNGLLLCPDHDRLFDRGFISFGDMGEIIISSHLSANNKIFMNIHEQMKISVTDDNREYIRYHREKVFVE